MRSAASASQSGGGIRIGGNGARGAPDPARRIAPANRSAAPRARRRRQHLRKGIRRPGRSSSLRDHARGSGWIAESNSKFRQGGGCSASRQIKNRDLQTRETARRRIRFAYRTLQSPPYGPPGDAVNRVAALVYAAESEIVRAVKSGPVDPQRIPDVEVTPSGKLLMDGMAGGDCGRAQAPAAPALRVRDGRVRRATKAQLDARLRSAGYLSAQVMRRGPKVWREHVRVTVR